MNIRCFIAVEFAEEVIGQLGRLQNRLVQIINIDQKAIKWVKPERIHLTLKFFGDIPEQEIAEICRAMDETARKCESFTIKIAGYGCFGSSGSARVLWAGIDFGADKLINMHEILEASLAERNFSPEGRRFRAHLTLARIKDYQVGKRVYQAVEGVNPNLIAIEPEISCLTLFQSVLGSGGPDYTVLHRAEL